MNKKKYIKPELDELTDVVNMILTVSTTQETDEPGLSRQQNGPFTEDDLDSDE